MPKRKENNWNKKFRLACIARWINFISASRSEKRRQIASLHGCGAYQWHRYASLAHHNVYSARGAARQIPRRNFVGVIYIVTYLYISCLSGLSASHMMNELRTPCCATRVNTFIHTCEKGRGKCATFQRYITSLMALYLDCYTYYYLLCI